ncbi:MAG: tetratricopeptide repeat protein, partial [Alistipes sp.]
MPVISMKIKIVATLITLLFVSTTSGQNSKADSLETLLSTHTRIDTARVNLLNKLAYEEFMHNPQKAKSHAQESWKASSTLNYPKGKAASLWVSGLVCLKSDKREALNYFQKALAIAKQIEDKAGMCNYLTAIGNVTKDMGDIKTSDDAKDRALQLALQLDDRLLIIKCRFNISLNMKSSGKLVEAAQQLQEAIILAEKADEKSMLAKAYGSLAAIYHVQGNSSTALEYYISALELNEKSGETRSRISNLINIAGVQSDQNEFDAALETIHKALQSAQEQNDSLHISVCYTNIGNIYRQMNNPKALDYFQKSLSLSKYGNIGQRINNLMNIGAIYTTQKEFGKALQSLDQALELAQKVNMQSAIGEVYSVMSGMYIAQKQYDTAKTLIHKARALAETIGYTTLLKDCNKMLSDIAAATGNFQEAYSYYAQYKSLCDSLLNEKNTRKIALLESSYK